MAGKQKPPVVVAELGRPETPSETASRKAEQSRLYKQRKTVNNLVFSLLVSLGLVLVMVLVVPRGTDQWSAHTVNVAESAQQSEASAGRPLIAPEVPETWKAKQALVRGEGDTVEWYVGYTTENEAYAALSQAFTASGDEVDETWISQRLEGQDPTGSERIGDLDWIVYDHPKRNPDETNMVFGLQARIGTTTLLVYGTDRPEVLRTLAADVARQAKAAGLDQTAPIDPATSDEEETS